MGDIQLDDLLVWYPNQDDQFVQTWVTGMKEFFSQASDVKEPVPRRGQPFKHQELLKRLMYAFNYMYAMHRTGTGKTCASIHSAEHQKVKSAVDLSDELLRDPKTNIKRVLILVKGKILGTQFKEEIICKCTDGTYETKKLREAQTIRAQRTNATKILSTYYEITQYGSFANSLELLSDTQIAKKYADYFIILDEIQSLRNSIKDDVKNESSKETGFKKRYDQVLRLIKHAPRIKVLILSATPMVNTPEELSLIMNLLYPDGQQLMPRENYSDSDWNVNKIEPYLRGRISFVRELDTGVRPLFIGTEIPGTYQTLYLSPMSELQQRTYDSQPNSADFHILKREASIFVYPNGEFTNEKGFSHFIDQVNNDVYRARPELTEYIKHKTGEKNLSILSKKYQNIIDLCNEAGDKNCFIFTDFVTGPGAIVLGLCFEAQGYGRFMETSSIFEHDIDDEGKMTDIDSYCEEDDPSERQILESFKTKNRNRYNYAIITRETPEARIKNIKTVYNSYQNRHGALIKILIGSIKIREGLNLANVQSIHIVGGAWNEAVTYQAISRGIRATSHVLLIQEKQDEIIGVNSINENSSVTQIGQLYALMDQSMKTIDFEQFSIFANIYSDSIVAFNELAGTAKLPDIDQIKRISNAITGIEKAEKRQNPIIDTTRELINTILSLNNQLIRNTTISRAQQRRINQDIKLNISKLVPYIEQYITIPVSNIISKPYMSVITKEIKNPQLKPAPLSLNDRKRLRNKIMRNFRQLIEMADSFINGLTSQVQNQYDTVVTEFNQLMANYNDPYDARIDINIYKHAAVYNEIDPQTGQLDIGKLNDDGTITEGPALQTVDVMFYKISEKKDREIRKVERYLKQVAVDGQIHKRRNIRDSPPLDGTPMCDYQKCDFKLFDPQPLTIYMFNGGEWLKIYRRAVELGDTIYIFNGQGWLKLPLTGSTIHRGLRSEVANPNDGDILLGTGEDALDDTNYDNIYAKKDIAKAVKAVINVLRIQNRLTYNDLYRLLPDHKKRHILEAVIQIIDGKMPIRNRSGVISYINEENSTIFIQPEYPHNPFYQGNQLSLGYYTSHLHGVQNRSLDDLYKMYTAQVQSGLLDKFNQMAVDAAFDRELNKLSSNERANLIEQSLDELLSGNATPAINAILSRFKNWYYFMQVPNTGLENYRKVILDRGSSRGRKREIGKIPTITEQQVVDDYVKYEENKSMAYFMTSMNDDSSGRPIKKTWYTELDLSSGQFRVPTEEPVQQWAVAHIAYVVSDDLKPSEKVHRLRRANGRLRIRTMENNQWRDIEPNELIVYASLLQLEIGRIFNAYNDLPAFGLYIPGEKFRLIRNPILQDINKQSVQKCDTLKHVDIAQVLVALGVDPVQIFGQFSETEQRVDQLLYAQMGDAYKQLNDEERVIYFRVLDGNIKLAALCVTLQDILINKERETGRSYRIVF